ncbi:hypothetical protein K9M74_02260 [Candidatus Woesearchaeota archaeon]|nr:hypothetical protein [Candidatus Woesearchaeota archaeon]
MEKVNIDKNTPERKFRASPVTATIWANEGKTKDGTSNLFRTITLERSYKDKENIWQTTNSFRVNDLPKAALVLNKAFEYISIKEEGDIIGED